MKQMRKQVFSNCSITTAITCSTRVKTVWDMKGGCIIQWRSSSSWIPWLTEGQKSRERKKNREESRGQKTKLPPRNEHHHCNGQWLQKVTGKEIHLWVSSSCFDRCREECAFSLSIGFFADNDKKKGQLSFVDSILLICLTLSSY